MIKKDSRSYSTPLQSQLRNFIYYKSGNMAQAEDLVQDAFSKLWENCAKVVPEKGRSYLYRVANNLISQPGRPPKGGPKI